MDLDSNDIYLRHFGVKGMKWGVRNSTDGGSKKSPASTAATLTDKELRKRINRLNMEKQYIDLVSQKTQREKSVMRRGAEETSKMLQKSAKKTMQKALDKKTAELYEVVADNLPANMNQMRTVMSISAMKYRKK